MDKAALDLWKDRADFWALIFAFVVGVGVVGEFVAHFAYRYFSRKLEPLLAQEEAQLRKNVAAANVRAAEANQKTEALHKENLELEASLSPRIFKDQGAVADRLRKFAPIDVVIEYLSTDRECRDTARQISFTLEAAGWKVLSIAPNPDDSLFWPDGVSVQYTASIVESGNFDSQIGAFFRTHQVTGDLLSELNGSGIEAHSAHPAHWKSAPPPGVALIRVGTRPNPALNRLMREHRELWKRLNKEDKGSS